AVKEAAPAAAPAKPAAKDSGVRVQLGAYRSEKEALSTWGGMQKKHSELAGRQPQVVRADLGAKGIFYRLRVGGFSGMAEARDFCKGLSSKGQACIVATP